MADTDKKTPKPPALPKPKVKDLPVKDTNQIKGGRVWV
jgi:hypothetical protein